MTEPTVPVPVSLIDRAEQVIASMPQGHPDRNAVQSELIALLSQPTPTAEPKYAEASTAPMRMRIRGDGFVTSPAAPPSITDMAPGTTFTAELLVGSGVWRWRWDGARALCLNDAYALAVKPSAIDPSTIRDVTFPTEGAADASI